MKEISINNKIYKISPEFYRAKKRSNGNLQVEIEVRVFDVDGKHLEPKKISDYAREKIANYVFNLLKG